MLTVIDDSYLDKLGVIKNGEYREYLGDKLLELLNMRMANRVTEILEDDQIQNLMTMPEGRRIFWMEQNIPGFQGIIEEELEEIVRSLKAVMPS